MSFWNIERIDILRRGVAAGKNFREIGLEIGCTRLAALGKWNRLRIREGYKPIPRNVTREDGISPELKRNTTPKRIYTPKTAPPAVPKAGVGFILPAIVPAIQYTGPAVGILDITGCKWAVGEDAGLIGSHAFCNAPRKPGDSRYCPHHAAMAKGAVPPASWVKVAA